MAVPQTSCSSRAPLIEVTNQKKEAQGPRTATVEARPRAAVTCTAEVEAPRKRPRGESDESLSPAKKRLARGTEEAYLNELYGHYKRAEAREKRGTYLCGGDVNAKMRAILVDWMAEVHFTFQLSDASLYLAVSLLDEYLRDSNVTKSKLQLVGITALFIAAKYEDTEPPELADCVYVTNDTYTEDDILTTECDMLRALDWRLTRPVASYWIARCCAGETPRTHLKAHFYAQRILQEEASLDMTPSLLGAAAACLASGSWSKEFQTLAGYSLADLEPHVQTIADHVSQHTELGAVEKKFSSSLFGAVAFDPPPSVPSVSDLVSDLAYEQNRGLGGNDAANVCCTRLSLSSVASSPDRAPTSL